MKKQTKTLRTKVDGVEKHVKSLRIYNSVLDFRNVYNKIVKLFAINNKST